MTPSGAYVRTEEQKQKIAATLKNRMVSPATKAKMSIAHQQKTHSLDTKRKIQYTQRMKRREHLHEEILSLREPDTLSGFIGAEHIKREIRILLDSHTKSSEIPGHFLITGLAGAGKSKLSKVLVNEFKGHAVFTFASLLKTQEDVVRLFKQLSWEGYDDQGLPVGTIKKNFVVCDEIHKLKHPELLFQALDEQILSIKTFDALSGEEMVKKFRLPRFCLVGISNRAGELPPALLERFKIGFRLETYSLEELSQILLRVAQRHHWMITQEALTLLVSHAKGIPRLALALLERVRNLQVAQRAASITQELVQEMFEIIHIYPTGLTDEDIHILQYLYRVSPNRVGVNRLAALAGETSKSFINSIEPFLLKSEMMVVTPGGRSLGKNGYEYLKLHKLIRLPSKELITRLDIKTHTHTNV